MKKINRIINITLTSINNFFMIYLHACGCLDYILVYILYEVVALKVKRSILNDFYGVYFYGGTALLYKTIIYTNYLVYL